MDLEISRQKWNNVLSESGHFWPGPRRLRTGRVGGTRGSILSEPGAQSLKYVKVNGSQAYMEASEPT